MGIQWMMWWWVVGAVGSLGSFGLTFEDYSLGIIVNFEFSFWGNSWNIAHLKWP
jgi:hypothetical protein